MPTGPPGGGGATIHRYGAQVHEQGPARWDEAASTFDQSADHGLRDPAVRAAWADLLTRALPAPPARLVDLGCGTGSLAVLAAELGHQVVGVDFSERMLALARTKAQGRRDVVLVAGDAADPPLRPGAVDAVLCRHVLWALPDPAAALQAWARLLRPGGRLVLVEGRWSTGAGLTGEQTVALLQEQGLTPTLEPLRDPRYWGAPVADDRYLVTARGRAR